MIVRAAVTGTPNLYHNVDTTTRAKGETRTRSPPSWVRHCREYSYKSYFHVIFNSNTCLYT